DEPQYLKLMTVQEGYNIEGFTFSETANSGDDGSEEFIPKSFTLGNYPNPFNSKTTIIYDVPLTTDVNLSIYDINGVQVKRLYSGLSSIGENKFIWNGVNDLGMLVSSGVYFYRLEGNDFVRTRKMVLVK
ncbi:MAG: T9SS type A sorting domain-containing protein, partial [Candidatus Marinimicrobia bacterium]|nr:T9SS type A sorting domain-containing protein [Candidatus Neomarinimicrobiota bacterium]